MWIFVTFITFQALTEEFLEVLPDTVFMSQFQL